MEAYQRFTDFSSRKKAFKFIRDKRINSCDSINLVGSAALSELWHKNLSQVCERGITYLAKKNFLAGMKQTKVKRCVNCLARKHKRVPFHNHLPSRKSELLELVHSDLCGLFKVKSKGGALYFATFIDDHSRKIWVLSFKLQRSSA